jgi:NAD-dependent dihydropyrimidine dehydrogenase PreA subunit
MIELLLEERCTQCGQCVSHCPMNVFEAGAGGVPVIARQHDCQTCYMCEMYCAADALYVGSNAFRPEHPGREEVIASGQLGRIRRDSGWDEWRGQYPNRQWYMGEVFRRARDAS